MALTSRVDLNRGLCAGRGEQLGGGSISSALLDGSEKEELAQAMEGQYAKKKVKLETLKRDAQNIRRSAAALLIGVKGTMPKRPELPLNCGACGYSSCAEFIRAEKKEGECFAGPLCVFQAIDLGIALGVAAKMAGELNIDNRIFY
jgi:uncharacterized ferredoxin-like protein